MTRLAITAHCCAFIAGCLGLGSTHYWIAAALFVGALVLLNIDCACTSAKGD